VIDGDSAPASAARSAAKVARLRFELQGAQLDQHLFESGHLADLTTLHVGRSTS
jgi:hypothetical protein